MSTKGHVFTFHIHRFSVSSATPHPSGRVPLLPAGLTAAAAFPWDALPPALREQSSSPNSPCLGVYSARKRELYMGPWSYREEVRRRRRENVKSRRGRRSRQTASTGSGRSRARPAARIWPARWFTAATKSRNAHRAWSCH